MEQIVKLLFASTLLAIFSYILIFSSIGQAGNGGEYWGYDGFEEPYSAAIDAYDSKDYRFLLVNFPNAAYTRSNFIPAIKDCVNHPFGMNHSPRPILIERMHGEDSMRLAHSFAHSFNLRLADLMNDELDAQCTILMSF